MNNATSHLAPRVSRLTARLSALGVLACSPLNAQAPASNTGVAVTRTVVSGIPVILKRVTANDVVAVQLYLKGGSAALTPATSGIESLMGDAMTKGTEKFNKDRFSALATSTGTTIQSAVDYDRTTFTMQAVRQNWAQAWDLFTEAMLHPTFPADEVAQSRDQIINDVKQRIDDPDNYLELLADSAVYAGHPYAVDPAGTPQSLAKLTRDDLMRWHKSRFTKANLLIVVVGNVAPEDLTAKITAAFGSLPATGGAPKALAALTSVKGAAATVKRDLPTNYIEGIFRAPPPSSPDFAPLRVAMLVLSDRLFEEVRTKRNLTYATFSQLSTRAANRGRIYVTAVDPDTTIKVMMSVVKEMQDAPASAQLLREQVGTWATGYYMGQQANMGQASSLALWELNGGGYGNAISYIDRLRAVKPADVQRVARTYLKDFRWVVIGDPAKATVTQQAQYTSPGGTAYFAQRDTGTVRRAEQALAADPGNVDLIVKLGTAQAGIRDMRGAISTFTKGIAAHPNEAILYRWRGHRYLSVREFDKALADFSKGLAIDSTVYGIWYHLGIVRFVKGEFNGAAAAFSRAQPRAPDPGELAGSTDWLWMSLARAGRMKEGDAMLARHPDSLKTAPDYAYTKRLRMYRGEVTPERLITASDTADVQAATLNFGLGNWYLVHGDTARARAAFERSVKSGGWPGFGFIVSEAELRRLAGIRR